jgi:translocation and assembly module TamB
VRSGAFTLAGRVRTVEGHLVVMNRRFDITRARVVFSSTEPPANPRLDVTAVHESPYARVTVTVGGTPEQPVTALRSEPAMSEAEIATLLATGRPELKRGGGGLGEASGAASALGAIASAGLKKGIAAKLPVDVLSFQAGEEGFEGSTLEAGSYVTDRVYVGYSRTFTEEDDPRKNTNEVRVEYQLAPQWTLESAYGDKATGGLDLFWTRDF